VEDMLTSDIQGFLDEAPLPITLGLRLPTLERKQGTRTRRRRARVSVCTTNCRGSYRVVTEAIVTLGWQDVGNASTDASVVWLEHSDPTDGLAPVQTMSRIEAFLHYCRKVRLATSLNTWIRELPDEFAFSPETWVLPDDAGDLELAMSRSKDTFIAKPTAGSQGRGIVLARKWKDLEHLAQKSKVATELIGRQRNASEYVVQRYFSKPLLLDNLKFDLRLYAVVTSVVPLRAYLFKEGLARFCTVPYQPPRESNLHEACMHLTNFAVNKKSKDFRPSENIAQHGEGSKRSASAVFRQIEQQYGTSPDELWAKVMRMAANTLMALRPGLVEYYVHEQPRPLHPVGPKGFQIIGLDVLIDSDLEPRLLELNANPSLSVMQPGSGQEQEEEVIPEGTSTAELPQLAAAARASAVAGCAPASTSTRQRSLGRSARRSARSRLGISDTRKDGERTKNPQVLNELDLAIKKELVSQALRLAHPAPSSKVARVRKKWLQSSRPTLGMHIPLDDEGQWALAVPPTRLETVRPDACGSCPALDPLDFDCLAAEGVSEYAKAHLSLYRCWLRWCGQGQDTLGQAPMLKLIERIGLVGQGATFPDRVTAQLWLSKEWRDTAGGAFGLSLPQFVALVGRIGCRMLGSQGNDEELDGPSHVEGVVNFVNAGLSGRD